MTFLETIFARLEDAADEALLGEVRDGKIIAVTGADLLALIAQARGFATSRGLKPGDRCALLAPNSIRWVAFDLALMSEGVIVVPLDPRHTHLAREIRRAGDTRRTGDARPVGDPSRAHTGAPQRGGLSSAQDRCLRGLIKGFIPNVSGLLRRPTRS